MKNKLLAIIYFLAMYIPVTTIVAHDVFQVAIPSSIMETMGLLAGLGILCLTPVVAIRLYRSK